MTKKTIFEYGNVGLKRINNSVNGNPAYSVAFFNGICVITGRTASDASYCYALPHAGYFENVTVKYHRTASGKVIFDDITILK